MPLRRDGHNHSAVFKGPTALRAGFTNLIAAVYAEGCSVIRWVEELDRGYEEIGKGLRALGAAIKRKQD